jgi:DNA polymerase delta subunit 1
MLIDRDVKGAEELVARRKGKAKLRYTYLRSYVKQTIADLLQNKIDMSQLVITKALAKAGGLF